MTKLKIYSHRTIHLNAGQSLHTHITEIQFQIQRTSTAIRNVKPFYDKRFNDWKPSRGIAGTRILMYQICWGARYTLRIGHTATRYISGWKWKQMKLKVTFICIAIWLQAVTKMRALKTSILKVSDSQKI